ncbi:MAG: SDR family oxidoreductase [Candidatus Rokubacteria bacterium]|nr:SDR family oxidoreductase [Candidatus Rokubacteria bacterium]
MSDAPLAGRVALVTGGSRGIGRAIALRLAADGADCVVTYRREAERAREVAAEIGARGRRGLALELPLEDRDRVGPVFERVAEEFGRLDILVANAAATAFRPMAEQKPHNVDLTFAITVDSFVAAVQAAVPLMRDRGRIVAISGIDSHQAMPRHGVIGGAKAAVESLVRTLALELGPQGVTVNGVSPGIIETDSSRTYLGRGLGIEWPVAAARLRAMTPVRRLGTPEDVAALVAFLASDGAGFLTGQTILLDGGLTIVSPLGRLELDDKELS